MRPALKQIIFGASEFADEADALFARMTAPPNYDRKRLISDTFRSLKDSGIYAKAGFIHFLAAHDAQALALCWNNPAYDLTSPAAPTFVADLGSKGNGTSFYWNVGTSPATLAGFAQDAATVATWETENIAEANPALGLVSGSVVQCLGRNASDNAQARVNVTAGTAFSSLDSRGLTAATRTSSALQTLYRNGAAVGTSATASSALSANNFAYLRLGGGYSSRRVGFGFAGGVLSAQQHADLNSIVTNYMVRIGAA